MIKVYLDNCVYNRPFDNQSNERIFIEARAFYVILKWIEEGKIMTISSDALEYENSMTSNPDRRMRKNIPCLGKGIYEIFRIFD